MCTSRNLTTVCGGKKAGRVRAHNGLLIILYRDSITSYFIVRCTRPGAMIDLEMRTLWRTPRAGTKTLTTQFASSILLACVWLRNRGVAGLRHSCRDVSLFSAWSSGLPPRGESAKKESESLRSRIVRTLSSPACCLGWGYPVRWLIPMH